MGYIQSGKECIVGRMSSLISASFQPLVVPFSRHIADDVDVPAGDIGVGPKEVGYLFGQYKRMTGKFQASMTGKGETFGTF